MSVSPFFIQIHVIMKLLKKAKFLLQLWEGIWSVPIAMLSFLVFGVLLQWVFTNPDDPQGTPGFYDPSFLQVAFYATAMQVFINFVVWLGFYFNFRGIWRYYIGYKDEGGKVVNNSKEDFLNILPWQRIALLLSLYFLLSLEWVVLFALLR